MDFSCHTWAFNDLTLPEALGTIARMGFRYVDIGTGPHLNPVRAAAAATRMEALAEIRDDLAMFNLKVADVYLMLPRISSEDEVKRNADLTLFKALIPFVKAFGAPGVTVSPGLAQPAEDTDAFERTAGMLRDMVAIAAKVELPVSIEPHLDSIAAMPDAALKMVNAVPGLKITLDIAHMVCQKAKPKDIWSLLPHTRHFQIRQAKTKRLQMPFDKGSVDVNEVVSTLRQAGYKGFISVEYLQTINWHGAMKVNNLTECLLMRDALKKARDTA